MKRIIVILLFMCHQITFTQNLVPNAGFENYTNCPTNVSQLHYADLWFPAYSPISSGSTDYFNQCATSSSFVDVPTNNFGYQYAKTGVAYAGFILFYDSSVSPNYREYAEIGLTDSLIAGKKYCVEFYVSLSNYSMYAIDAIGAYFSNDSIFATPPNFLFLYTPQVINPINNIISDTTNWVLISGEFTAVGGEKFITIGNFKDDANTNVDTVNTTSLAYYYIDDVSVYNCDSIGINEPQENIIVNIYPNPSNGKFTIESKAWGDLSIYNLLGEKIYGSEISKQEIEIDISNKPKGIYFIQLITEKGAAVRKIVVQ